MSNVPRGPAVTPKQRKRALKKEHRALRPEKVAAPKPGPIPDPWGVGRPRAAKQYPPRPVTECLHVLAVRDLVDEKPGRLTLRTTFAYCRKGGIHTEHRGDGQVWA